MSRTGEVALPFKNLTDVNHRRDAGSNVTGFLCARHRVVSVTQALIKIAKQHVDRCHIYIQVSLKP
jgi:hypothetical protein